MSTSSLDLDREWLETDGLGGFAMGTAGGPRTRRYHGLLATATSPPTGRVMLVPAVEAWVETVAGPRALTSHRYAPGVTHPDGAARRVDFRAEPFPTWTYELEDGTRIEHSAWMAYGRSVVVLTWRALSGGARHLSVRPFLAARDLHGLSRDAAGCDPRATVAGDEVRWTPRPGLPGVRARSTGTYRHAPDVYRDFLYEEELARGYDGVEDLLSPGVFELTVDARGAALVLAADAPGLSASGLDDARGLRALVADWTERELARRTRGDRLERAVDSYLVRRGSGASLIAGYPWFTDWGRDTFLALRGLLLATGRLAEAGSVLGAWAALVDGGMLPNRFVDLGGEPEYNTVDGALWFAVAVGEYLDLRAHAGRPADAEEAGRLLCAVQAVLEGYAAGTRYGIRADDDGLLRCGEPGVQLTWMDAKVGQHVVTPRSGKPVEVQALWVNALFVGERLDPRWRRLRERAEASFGPRFWNPVRGALLDVADDNHVPGANDASLRPNQILAVGGLPRRLCAGPRARAVVDRVEEELWTPLGLRTLEASDPRYHPTYGGPPSVRDDAYHQGTVWPWLLGPFVDAWVQVRGNTAAARAAARERFLAPLLAHLDQAGLGHVSEVADAEAPHRPGGCPFQAWSLGELLRIERGILREPEPRATPRPRRSAAPRVP